MAADTNTRQGESRFRREAHWSSEVDSWSTPQALFDELDREFGFTLDACALPDNAKCERYFTPEQDALRQSWEGVVFMNPPYGREIGRWMAKAYASALLGKATVVCLVPARTDTGWWHDYCAKGEMRFIRGRLRFGDGKKDAPFPSAIVVFHRRGDGSTIDEIERDLLDAA